jgi:hypothetical protein
MTADDRRYTLCQAADLTNKSVDTPRRRCKKGKLPGAGMTPPTRPASGTSRRRLCSPPGWSAPTSSPTASRRR